MQVRKSLWAFLVVGLLVCLMVGWFLKHYGFYARFDNYGFGAEARVNPFLAAEKFLAYSGGTFATERSYSSLDSLPSTDTLLVILASRSGLSEARRSAIKDWVSAGGHVVLLATEVFDDEKIASNDVLLDELGVRLYSLTSEQDSKDFSERLLDNMFSDLFEPDDEEFNLIYHPKLDKNIKIRFNSNYYLYDDSGDAWSYSSDEDFEHYLSYDLGRGNSRLQRYWVSNQRSD